jgi:peptidoglycan hydrolase-like amidase
MCQYSAKELAERGQTWRSMITIFYPGARVERVY